MEFIVKHIQIIFGSYFYIQIRSCSVYFSQKMDTLAFSKIFYGVLCSCNSEVFFVNSCSCSNFVNCIHIIFKVRSFFKAFFKGGFICIWSRRKQALVKVYKFLRDFVVVVEFYHFENKIHDKGLAIWMFLQYCFLAVFFVNKTNNTVLLTKQIWNCLKCCCFYIYWKPCWVFVEAKKIIIINK